MAADELARAIAAMGVPSACITGHTPAHERNRILRAYSRNEIRLLTSVMVLREGWDAPNAEVCLMLRPTKSRVLYVQTVGRVLRPSIDGRDKVALVLDGHFMDTTYEPLSAPVLFAPVGTGVTMGDIILQVNRGAKGPARPVAPSPYLSFGSGKIYRVEPIAVEYYAGKEGTFAADGEIWSTERGLAKVLGVDTHYIQSWATKGKARTRTAKTDSGQAAIFYALSDVAAAASATSYHSDVQSGAIARRAEAASSAAVQELPVKAQPLAVAQKLPPTATAQREPVREPVPAVSWASQAPTPAVSRGEAAEPPWAAVLFHAPVEQLRRKERLAPDVSNTSSPTPPMGRVLPLRTAKQKKAIRTPQDPVRPTKFLPPPGRDPVVEELLARWEQVADEVLAKKHDILAQGGRPLPYEERLRRLIAMRKEIAMLQMCRPLKLRQQPSQVLKRREAVERRAWMF